jgi:hypothetical protein
LHYFEEVEINGFRGENHGFDFLKLIFRCARKLKMVTIKLEKKSKSFAPRACAKKIYNISLAYPSLNFHVYLSCGSLVPRPWLLCSWMKQDCIFFTAEMQVAALVVIIIWFYQNLYRCLISLNITSETCLLGRRFLKHPCCPLNQPPRLPSGSPRRRRIRLSHGRWSDTMQVLQFKFWNITRNMHILILSF